MKFLNNCFQKIRGMNQLTFSYFFNKRYLGDLGIIFVAYQSDLDILTFYILFMIVKLLELSEISHNRFSMDLHVCRPSEAGNKIIAIASVCLSVCLHVCPSIPNTITLEK